jgi:hypothetical protein
MSLFVITIEPARCGEGDKAFGRMGWASGIHFRRTSKRRLSSRKYLHAKIEHLAGPFKLQLERC